MEISSAKTTRTVPRKRPDDVSAQSFVAERDNERAILERIKKENQARLAGLNSPLPSPSKKVPTPSPPVSQLDKLRKEQQARLAELNSPLPSPVKTTASLKSPFDPSALNTPLQRQSPNTNSPSSSPNVLRSEAQSDDTSTASETTQESPRLNLFDMTMRKGSSTDANASDPPPSSTSSSPTKRAPIRQKIEISDEEEDDDDEDDDFFQFTRNGQNSGMSIKDIMGSQKSEPPKDQAAKARSKMWGIDIDRFS
jgi:hypothetical protein